MFILRFLNNSVTVHLLASLVWIVNFGWSIVVIWLGKWPSGIQTSTLAPTWRGKKCTPKRVWYNWVLQNLMHCTKFAFHRIKKYIQLLRQFAAVQQGQLWTFRITASQLQILIPDVFTCLGRCAFSDCIFVFSDCCLYSCWKNSNDFHADVFAKKGSVRSEVYDSKCWYGRQDAASTLPYKTWLIASELSINDVPLSYDIDCKWNPAKSAMKYKLPRNY